jgi:hypothetical protein
MTAALTKQLSPRGTAILELVAPWGEYYARNQRTIPPLLYADMAVQSGVTFDAFGLQFHFGPAIDGMYVRDMFQISSTLDLFAKLGRPLHITGVQVPSDTTAAQDRDQNRDRHEAVPALALDGGTWHDPWTEDIQADWLRRFIELALSKPFVETVSWQGLADHSRQEVPHGGLLRADLAPKAAYRQLLTIRSELLGTPQKAAGESAAS